MIPVWLTTLPFGICIAQSSSIFFIERGATFNGKITHDFEIPPASMYGLGAIGMIVTVTIYDKILVPLLRRATGNERGISILRRIGVGPQYVSYYGISVIRTSYGSNGCTSIIGKVSSSSSNMNLVRQHG